MRAKASKLDETWGEYISEKRGKNTKYILRRNGSPEGAPVISDIDVIETFIAFCLDFIVQQSINAMQAVHADADAKVSVPSIPLTSQTHVTDILQFWRGQIVRLTITIPGMAIPAGSIGSVQDSFVSMRGNLFVREPIESAVPTLTAFQNYTYQILFDDGRTHRGVPETYLEAVSIQS